MKQKKSNEEYLVEVLKRIENDLATSSAATLIKEHYESRFAEPHFKKFQKYYFEHLGNIENLNEFVMRYSLRDVKEELEDFKKKKAKIEKLIKEEKLDEAWKEFHTKKVHGSFFTKVVHAYLDNKYTPLDIPMRKHLGMCYKDYFTSMLVISEAFKLWANKNRSKMEKMKQLLAKSTNKHVEFELEMTAENITDIKVMNAIYWSIANPPKK